MNLLKGNQQSIKRHHLTKLQYEVRLLSLKRNIWKQRRNVLASQIELHLIKVNTFAVINFLSFMEQLVLLPASVFNNKNLNTLVVTKEEPAKYQAEQNPTYQNDSLKKEIKTKNCLPKQTSYSTKLCLVRVEWCGS